MRLAALLLAAVSFCPGQGQPPVDWMREHAIPLDTAVAVNAFNDLQPLKAAIGNARIVSLGEATHGTREFFQMKHRMLEFLAVEMGFNIFAIEANMPEAYRLNDYVLHGVGDPAELLKGMYFWTWDTEEVLEMIRWMRDFNASGRGRVQFTGFDMQYAAVAAANVHNFLSTAEPSLLDGVDWVYDWAAKPYTASGYAYAYMPAPAAGRKLRISGFVRTENVERGWAGIACFVGDRSGGTLAYDFPAGRGLRGTNDWTPYEVAIEIPAGATGVQFGLSHMGDGTAWFDSLTVEIDGISYPLAIDLEFESATPRGFYTGGTGYSIRHDASVAHGGRQSLRMEWLGPSARDVAVWAAGVAEQLQASRDAYIAGGASAWEADWAIQNARIVAQAAEMAYDMSVRDRYMAQNAKWILDQNPGGKMVIWAHNLHVATGGNDVWPNSMGQELKSMYGQDLFTFGFAFNQGSFQAQGVAGLQEFTVGPAPGETLDGALAGTGIPILALPLKDAPAWLQEPQQTRIIGAGFGEGYRAFYPVVAPAAYDAILFVERTTRARPNP